MANALNKVKTSGVEDDAISLAKMAPGTDGQVITYDASGNPTAVGPGTDGQVLTSTGAGSPPAFEDLPTSGATLSGSTDNTVVTVTGANAMQGETNVKIDSSSRMMVGGGTSINTWGHGSRIQAQGTDFAGSSISVSRYSADASAPSVLLAKSRNGTIGTQTIVQDGDALGNIAWLASDGTDLNNDAARVGVWIDGTPAGNVVPGKIGIATTKANGQASWKLYIRANGDVEVVEGKVKGSGVTLQTKWDSDVTYATSRAGGAGYGDTSLGPVSITPKYSTSKMQVQAGIQYKLNDGGSNNNWGGLAVWRSNDGGSNWSQVTFGPRDSNGVFLLGTDSAHTIRGYFQINFNTDASQTTEVQFKLMMNKYQDGSIVVNETSNDVQRCWMSVREYTD